VHYIPTDKINASICIHIRIQQILKVKINFDQLHRRSQGCTGCTCILQGGETFFLAKFTGESCKCTPRQRVHLTSRKLVDLDSGRGYLGSFSVCFEGDDEKKEKGQLFWRRKVHLSPKQNPGYAYDQLRHIPSN